MKSLSCAVAIGLAVAFVWSVPQLGAEDLMCEGDFDGSGHVTIDELITAVNNALGGCPVPGPADTFPSSLHALRTGKVTFYSARNGGFETLTNVPPDAVKCVGCHAPTLADGTPVDPATYAPSCADCHADLDNPGQGITDALCLGCHARQGAEENFFPDVHRDAGMTCTSCHTVAEMHGDGIPDASHLETPGPQCESCHRADGPGGPLPINMAHTIHTAKVDCASCHVKSVVACDSCHFDSEVAGVSKRFYGPPRRNFKMLMNFRGKVYPATYQSLVYQDQSFYVLAPYYAHTVTSSVECSDCHGSAAAGEYKTTGQITITRYVEGALEGPAGTIPIPPNWQTALKFDFLDYTGDPSTPISQTDPALWQFLKTGADLTQMVYGTPLTHDQVNKLAQPYGQ